MKLLNRLIFFVIRKTAYQYQEYRIALYHLLSNNKVVGSPKRNIPCIFTGKGDITFNNNVTLGVFPSPNFFNGSIYIESRSKESKVKIGANVFINNNFRLICDKTEIIIEDNCLIGTNVEIIDSDFHEIDPKNRNSGNHATKKVHIKKNVFIGNNVTILKGVEIGENSIIANSSLIFENVPSNSIFGGNPAKLIKKI